MLAMGDDVDVFVGTLLLHESCGPGSSKADFAVWSEMAQNREVWQHLEGDYLIFCEHRLDEV